MIRQFRESILHPIPVPFYQRSSPSATVTVFGGQVWRDTKEGKKRYWEFVLSGLQKGIKDPLGEVKAGVLLGTEQFEAWVRKTFIDRRKWQRKEQPQARRLKGTVAVEEIAQAVGEEYGVKPGDLLTARSPHREARRVLTE